MKKLLLSFVLMMICTFAYSATYYVATTGNDTTGDGSIETPWLTIRHGAATMSGGDTLIIRDGTYTGDDNCLDESNYPPAGSAIAWTIIKAENDGMAIIDGEGAREPLKIEFVNATTVYWQFEGLDFRNANYNCCLIYGLRQVKFLRCGASEAGDGNCYNFGAGRSGEGDGCQYILYENCYAYGSGRYKFIAGGTGTSNIIFRQCVGRVDRAVADDPTAVFASYGSSDILYQNCIALDSDTTGYMNVTGMQGGFFVPSTSGNAFRIKFDNCISLNNHIGGVETTGNSSYAAYYTTFTNCVVWDCLKPDGETTCLDRGVYTYFNQCTMGDTQLLREAYLNSLDGDAGSNTTVINSIFTDIDGVSNASALRAVESETYNSFYNNVVNIFGGSPDASDITTIDPIWTVTNDTAPLKYIIHIETSSLHYTAGSGGVVLGANIQYLQGYPGTLWGDENYNVQSATAAFPFAYEDLIKTKLAAYSYDSGNLSGARGFCSSGKQMNGTDDITLTSYIYEYLGNQMPESVYGEEAQSATIYNLNLRGISLQGVTLK